MRNGQSLGAIWEEALAFFKAEAQLVLPLAFLGFGVPLVALQFAAPRPISIDGQIVAGPWLFWLLPWMIGGMTATMAISALALRPGRSVGEALRLAIARLAPGLALIATAVAAIVALSVLVSVVAGVEAALRGQAGGVFTLALMAALVAFIATLVRVLPVWVVLVDGPPRPFAALRASFAITRQGYLRLLMLRVVAWVAQTVSLFVLLMPIAVTFALIGRATGTSALCEGLSLICAGGVLSTILALWTIYVARLYRTLSSGT